MKFSRKIYRKGVLYAAYFYQNLSLHIANFNCLQLYALTGGHPVELIDSPLIALDHLCIRPETVTFAYETYVFAYAYLRRGGAACRFQL